jgi:Haem-binding domain
MVAGGFVVVATLLLVAQLFPVPRHNPPVESEVPASPEARVLLRRVCYDCHSNETVWPWYAHVAPVAWVIGHDVEKGRASVNFSTWAAYDIARRSKLLRESAEEIADGEMPPWYYRLMHPEARLTPADADVLRAWALGDSARQ